MGIFKKCSKYAHLKDRKFLDLEIMQNSALLK